MKWYPPPPKPKKTQRLSGVASVLKKLTKSDGELGKTCGEQVDASDDEDGRRKPSGVFAKVSKEARVALRREANEREISRVGRGESGFVSTEGGSERNERSVSHAFRWSHRVRRG